MHGFFVSLLNPRADMRESAVDSEDDSPLLCCERSLLAVESLESLDPELDKLGFLIPLVSETSLFLTWSKEVFETEGDGMWGVFLMVSVFRASLALLISVDDVD